LVTIAVTATFALLFIGGATVLSQHVTNPQHLIDYACKDDTLLSVNDRVVQRQAVAMHSSWTPA
jgi:hypothetical protein